MAKSEGGSVGPLGKGGKAGIPFEQGGGFSMHYEDEYIQLSWDSTLLHKW